MTETTTLHDTDLYIGDWYIGDWIAIASMTTISKREHSPSPFV